MREILFRGKRLYNGEWVYGSYVQQYGAATIYLPDGVDSEYGFDNYPVDPETVGQFTGLTDKNGVRIFEGDILQFEDDYALVRYSSEDAMFELRFDTFVSNFSKVNINMYGEVVANIHDNPELLEVI